MNLKIKRLDVQKADRAKLAHKLEKILKACYGRSPWSEAYLRKNLKTDTYFLAEAEGELVGFLSLL